MSEPGISSWRVFWAIWRVGVLRWTRRMLGRFRPLKRRSDMPAKRMATPRKGGWSPWLAAMLALPFVLIVVTNSSQLAWSLSRNLSREARTDRMGISGELRHWLKAKEAMAPATSRAASEAASEAATGRAPQSSPSTEAVRVWRQRVLAELVDVVDEEFFSSRQDRHGGGEAAKQRFTSLYIERGMGAVYEKDIPQAHAFPSRSLWPRAEHRDAMLVGLAVILTAIFVLVVANTLHASQDVAAGRWDMEWLFTLPLPARTIFLADMAKEVVSSPASWVIPLPFLWVVMFCAGYGWWASIGLAVAGGAFMVVLAEAVRLPVEVYLRQRLRADRLRNLFAALGVVSMVILIGLLTMASSGLGVDLLARLARAMPREVIYVPWALPLALCRGGAAVPATLATMGAVAALAVWGAGALAERAVRRGLVAESAGLSGRRARRAGKGGLPMRGVAGKELLLLARDRNYLVRTLILPVGLALFQVAVNPAMFHEAKRSLHHASALAFGLSAYMLLMSGTRLLIHEGQALWLLYTFPKTLDYVVRRKAVMWSAVAAVFAAAVLVGAGGGTGEGVWRAVEAWVTVLGGVVLFGMISAAVGVLACDPTETRQSKQVPAGAMYLLLLIAGMYASCFYVPATYPKVVTMAIFALAAVALWQKARARAPYLLDPVSRPPPSLDVADAIIAAFAFFAVQGVATVVLVVTQTSVGQAVAWGYSLAAVAVGVLSMLMLGARRIPGFFAQVGLAWPRGGAGAAFRSAAVSVGLGVGAGVAAAGFAAGYLWVVGHIPALRPWLEAPTLWNQIQQSDRVWMILMFVVAAPIFEEYLFRGLLLRSLQRHTGAVRAAVFSSVVFALMHPPIAFLPVTVLGLAAAASFGRRRSLAAPVLAHMVYNGLIVLVPMLTAGGQ